MYVLNVVALKNELSLQDLPSAESLKYLIGFAFMSLPSNAFASAMVLARQSYYPLLSAGLFVAGVLYCYSQNGGSRGTNFLPRFIALSWVVSVRFLLVVTPALLLMLLVSGVEWERFKASVLLTVASVVLALLYYYRLGVHVSDIASRA